MSITQEMMDSIPREWMEKIEKTPNKKNIDPTLRENIEKMITIYGNIKSNASIALACGVSEGFIYDMKKKIQQEE